FGVWRDVGSVTPARSADIILLDGNLADVNVSLTIAAGEVVAEGGRMTADLLAFEYPDYALGTVKLQGGISEETFAVRAPSEDGMVRARTIRVVENHVETREEWAELPVEEGLVRLDPGQDVAKICVIERHGKTGERKTGFVVGLGFDRPAALATTVAHDSHNLMVMGNSEGMMARAARAVADEGGGVAVATEEELTLLPLPVAGLMSPEPYEEVAERSKAIGEALFEAGCRLNYAFMTLSLLALIVLPELHVSDKGLVGVGESGFEFVDLIEQG
ncbi:MAG TPA: adenine deaminase C-terminal domain-containing protein, partial [Rubrobacteraceae bacterium]